MQQSWSNLVSSDKTTKAVKASDQELNSTGNGQYGSVKARHYDIIEMGEQLKSSWNRSSIQMGASRIDVKANELGDKCAQQDTKKNGIDFGIGQNQNYGQSKSL